MVVNRDAVKCIKRDPWLLFVVGQSIESRAPCIIWHYQGPSNLSWQTLPWNVSLWTWWGRWSVEVLVVKWWCTGVKVLPNTLFLPWQPTNPSDVGDVLPISRPYSVIPSRIGLLLFLCERNNWRSILYFWGDFCEFEYVNCIVNVKLQMHPILVNSRLIIHLIDN
jgi:hypothetical protein